MFTRIFVVCLLVCGCSQTTLHSPSRALPDPSVADSEAYASLPDGLGALAASHLPSDDSGLIGRNRKWGALYSPRFHLGAGAALRVSLAADRPAKAAHAFRAVEAGADVIRPDGFVPSRVPPEVGGPLSATDIASAAAFFLGDACLGLLALEAVERSAAVVSDERRTKVRERLVRAVEWLLTQQQVLMTADRRAPNRLLFSARAFQACGALASGTVRPTTERAAASFVEAALRLHADDGYFIEGGGHDTSYQGVALRVGEDVLLAGYPDTDGRLRSALTGAAEWLANRVDPEGRIDSSGNTRTCASGETWLGKPKRVSVAEVFAGLVYAGVRTGRDSPVNAARRIEAWVRANPGTDPCFSFSS